MRALLSIVVQFLGDTLEEGVCCALKAVSPVFVYIYEPNVLMPLRPLL